MLLFEHLTEAKESIAPPAKEAEPPKKEVVEERKPTPPTEVSNMPADYKMKMLQQQVLATEHQMQALAAEQQMQVMAAE